MPYPLSKLIKNIEQSVTNVASVDTDAITARVNVTKQSLIASAQSSSRMGAKFGRRFVNAKVTGRNTGELRLQGGFGYLTQLGSYKASGSGWDEYPKSGGQALNTQYGFFAKVDHPPIAAHPFWDQGLAASIEPASAAYRKVVDGALLKAWR